MVDHHRRPRRNNNNYTEPPLPVLFIERRFMTTSTSPNHNNTAQLGLPVPVLPSPLSGILGTTIVSDAKCGKLFFFLAIGTTLVASYRLAVESHAAHPADHHGALKSINMKQQRVVRPKNLYLAAPLERYIMDHSIELGFDVLINGTEASGCDVWRRRNNTTTISTITTPLDTAGSDVAANANVSAAENPPQQLQQQQQPLLVPSEEITDSFYVYLRELEEYNRLVADFAGPSVDGYNFTDLRDGLHLPNICDSVQLHPDGLPGIFSESRQLSHFDNTGYTEPLLPPLRHPAYCFDDYNTQETPKHLLDLTYLVHDFSALCRTLTPTSKTVLVDMGASLVFHTKQATASPELYLTSLYEKFGFPFDHIYAYEITPQNASSVYEIVPLNQQAAYHFINAGVDSHQGARLNPFTLLLQTYSESDVIVVKLDVDHAETELPLSQQLLHDPTLMALIDHFYFEHHVHLQELAKYWTISMQGSVHDSLQLFSQLRQKGVAAHYWV